jgi:predicted house-cleaning noncanonical NTP pyrophosphatase (MazG superfamily)
MEKIWPYLSFILGAFFGILYQWISYLLSFRKDQRKEFWIRKLNSYQDFYHHTSQLIDLLRMEVKVPENIYWEAISSARKAAYDASFYDLSNLIRTEKMKKITSDIVNIYQSETTDMENLAELMEHIEKIQESFYNQENLLLKEAFKNWLAKKIVVKFNAQTRP